MGFNSLLTVAQKTHYPAILYRYILNYVLNVVKGLICQIQSPSWCI